jgi:transcriptional regulator with XRE-family HTH domain
LVLGKKPKAQGATVTLGTRLRAARKAKGYSLRDVEKLVSVSASTISRLERDAGDARSFTLLKLANCYGVLFVDLVAPDDEMPEMTREEQDAFLIAHGYNLDELQREINELIDKLRVEAMEFLAKKARVLP